MAETTENEALKNTLAKPRQEKPGDKVVGLIQKMTGEMGKALPAHLKANSERYARVAITQIRQNPELAKCSAESILGALMTGTALGLDPSPSLGQYALVPYKGEAQFILEYQGMIDLAFRSGQIATIFATEVYEQDHFEYSLGLEQKLVHEPCGFENPGKVTHYYAVAKFVNGGYVFSVMTPEQVRAHAKKNSPSYSFASSPWQKHFDAMAKKTVLRQIGKYLPKSVELTKAMAHDEGVHKDIPEDGDILDITPTFNQPKLEAVETVEADGKVVEDGEVKG